MQKKATTGNAAAGLCLHEKALVWQVCHLLVCSCGVALSGPSPLTQALCVCPGGSLYLQSDLVSLVTLVREVLVVVVAAAGQLR